MDGLMFNTEEIYTLVGTELLRRRGCEFGDELKDAVMGLRPRPTFETMIRWHRLDETWEEIAAESNRIFVDLLDAHLAPMPGLLELLAALEKAGIPKAIGTSSGRELLDEVFGRFDLRSRFQFILTAEDITHGKPHPEIYLAAAERFGLGPQQTLVLEDSQNGCRAAAAAGALTVAVPGEHSRGHDFSAASLVVESLADSRLYEVLGIGRAAG
jgi:HAD superfamily hydrolase (TIGR01509 family)